MDAMPFAMSTAKSNIARQPEVAQCTFCVQKELDIIISNNNFVSRWIVDGGLDSDCIGK